MRENVLQWNDHDGGHLLLIDLHPLNWAPSQAWSVAPSNPMKHLHIREWWIGALSLSHLPLTHTALYLWPKKQERACFCCLNSTNHQTTHSWDPEPWPGTRTLRRPTLICFLQSDVRYAISVMWNFTGDYLNVLKGFLFHNYFWNMLWVQSYRQRQLE